MNEAIEIYKESCNNLLKENKKMCGIAIKALSDKAELEKQLKELDAQLEKAESILLTHQSLGGIDVSDNVVEYFEERLKGDK